MPKLIQNLSKRRIQQIVRDEINVAKLSVETGHQTRDNLQVQTPSINNINTNLNSIDDTDKNTNDVMMVDDPPVQPKNIGTNFTNNTCSTQIVDEFCTTKTLIFD